MRRGKLSSLSKHITVLYWQDLTFVLRIPTGYRPRTAKLFFDNNKSKYEVKFLGYLKIQHLHQIILSLTDQSDDIDFIEKDATIFAKLTQYLDDKSLSLVMRDAKDDGRKA